MLHGLVMLLEARDKFLRLGALHCSTYLNVVVLLHSLSNSVVVGYFSGGCQVPNNRYICMWTSVTYMSNMS